MKKIILAGHKVNNTLNWNVPPNVYVISKVKKKITQHITIYQDKDLIHLKKFT